MTVIERWTLRFVRYVTTESGSSHMNAVVRGPAVPWHGADVEVVPADAYQGAVAGRAALTRGLADAARALEECGQTRSAASARTIIAAHGGQ